VIGLRQNGASYAAMAVRFRLNQTGVFNICQRPAARREPGLVSCKRGHKLDDQRSLNATQEAGIQRPIGLFPKIGRSHFR
jgi:hypothetical protein